MEKTLLTFEATYHCEVELEYSSEEELMSKLAKYDDINIDIPDNPTTILKLSNGESIIVKVNIIDILNHKLNNEE